jgi:hypothetical protein
MTPRTPPPPVSYAVPGERSSPKFAAAFAAGCGGRAVNMPSALQPGDFAAFCTPPLWDHLRTAQQTGRNWYYADHAFFTPRRGKYFRVTKNAYQYQPSVGDLRAATPDRFLAQHVDLWPDWRRNNGGSAIVICPNSVPYMARFGIDAQRWTLDIVKQLGQLTDRPLIVRWKTQAARRPLYVDLHDAWAVIVYDSASAIEAIVAGVPVFVLAPHATTRMMGCADLTQIESPVFPDGREQFIWALAEHQWTLPEIAEGRAWKTLHR